MPRVVKEHVSKELACTLNEIEIRERGQEMARLMAERDQIEEDSTEERKRAKAEVKRFDKRISHLSREVRTEQTYREVECRLELDLDLGVAELVRTDTGEVIGTRPLEPQERQRELFGIEGGAKRGKRKAAAKTEAE